MTLVEHLRTAAKIARERDQLTAIPNGLEKAADRIVELEAATRDAAESIEASGVLAHVAHALRTALGPDHN